MKRNLIYLAGVIVLLLFFTCRKSPTPSKIIYHTSDTITIHDTIVDTLTFHHTNILPIHVDRMDLSDTNTFEYKYYYPIKDSLLDGVIIAESNDRPKIDFNYTLKNYHTTTTTTITDTFMISNHGFLYGGDVVVSPLLTQVSVGLSYQFKRGDLIDLSIGRDFNFNQNIIRLGYRRRF